MTNFETALPAQNTPQALQNFNDQAQFGPALSLLQPDLPQIVANFSGPVLVSISGNVGEYLVTRPINGADQAFFIYFLRDIDGVWRLDDM